MRTQGTRPDHSTKSIHSIEIFWVGLRLETLMTSWILLLVVVISGSYEVIDSAAQAPSSDAG